MWCEVLALFIQETAGGTFFFGGGLEMLEVMTTGWISVWIRAVFFPLAKRMGIVARFQFQYFQFQWFLFSCHKMRFTWWKNYIIQVRPMRINTRFFGIFSWNFSNGEIGYSYPKVGQKKPKENLSCNPIPEAGSPDCSGKT